ncbi:two-component system sensor histidine kinase CreC [Isoalcanivorax indicus]|uniref:two-component system sensor histidine kinase CreC n=1 Tax=Isoalcanivorax indicus TaxID=2202653 RepID=UPI000DB9BB7D|nr:two-component system sensor histidine kinase CreC [Isoalcanivorax indicus]
MTLSLRIFIGYFLLVGLGMMVFLYSTYDQLHPVLRQASEETLVDTANLLAEFAPAALAEDDPASSAFASTIERYTQRPLNARIWLREKTTPGIDVYLTDAQGRVVFHTRPEETGADYGRWRDVSLTLAGEYGARTTRLDPDDELTSVMYVAAPVRRDGEIIGVLTVAQPNLNIQPFLDYARRQILQLGSGILLVSLLLGGVISVWLTRSIRQLVQYVERAGRGDKVQPPILRETSLARLAASTERMRREIEGKAYVERYVENLAHEMKSPLSAIRGAVEILQEPDTGARNRERFLDNIDLESRRMQRLIDRLLSLAALENRHTLNAVETVDMATLVRDEITRRAPHTEARQIQVLVSTSGSPRLEGERFLLAQAVSNLLDNALDFCPPGGTVMLHLARRGDELVLSLHNDGDPIPDYARPRVFERFYSLSRPDSDRRSTGLGLSFVREIAELHQGRIALDNAVGGGVIAVLTLPALAEGRVQ